MAVLQILKGGPPGPVALDQDTITFGRNRECNVVIPSQSVSRTHAAILRIGGKYYIEDAQSRNGTFVNNQKITRRTALKDNDRIDIGEFAATFRDGPLSELPAQAAAAPAERAATPSKRAAAPAKRAAALVEQAAAPVERAAVPGEAVTVLGFNLDEVLAAGPKAAAAERLDALLDLSTRLGQICDPEEALRLTADCLFGVFRQADRAFVFLGEGTGSPPAPRLVRTRRPHEEATAGFSRRILEACLAAREPILSEDAARDDRFGSSASVVANQIHSVLAAPLRALDGRVMGALLLDAQDPAKRFTREDQRFVTGLASLVARTLDASRMHAEQQCGQQLRNDLERVRQVQRGFLPLRSPEVPGFELFAHSETFQPVSGVFHDFIPLLANRWVVVVGEVAGKGLSAALLSTKVSTEAPYYLGTDPDLAAGLCRLNEQLVRAGLDDGSVTLVAAVLDPVCPTVTLVSAGGRPALVYRRASRAAEAAHGPEQIGRPLGQRQGRTDKPCEVRLEPGDSILLFTDGISAALNARNEPLQVRGIVRATEGGPYSARQLGEQVLQAFRRHTTGRGPHDDISLICFGRTC